MHPRRGPLHSHRPGRPPRAHRHRRRHHRRRARPGRRLAALAQIPDVTVAEVGIAVALGVLIDTLLVRALQVPALVTLLAERTWWRPPGAAPHAAPGAGPR